MFLYEMDRTSAVPLYEQLTRYIQNDILEGRMLAGMHLPSKRQAARDLGVSVMTVQLAYGQLLAEGYIVAEERRGYFVAQVERVSRMPVSVETPRHAERDGRSTDDTVLDVTKNRVAAGLFPFSVWSKLSRRILSEKGVGLLDPVPSSGVPALREAIAEVLYQRCGMAVSPEQVVIGAGNESLYGILLTLLGRHNVYAVETPGYPLIDRLYRQQGVTVRHLPMDEQGISTEALAESDATVVHISPAHHFPTGTVTSVTRRQELLRWASEGERFIIEDDYDSEFRLSGRPIPPLQRMDSNGRVIYMNTFSKTVAPSLRIAYMVLPAALLSQYRDMFGFLSCPVAAFEQHTLAAFIREGYFDRHINRLRTHYRGVRDRLVTALTTGALKGRCYPVRDDAGLHFLVRVAVPPHVSDGELTRAALSCGLRIHTLSRYRHESEGGETHTFILNYSGLSSDAISVLAERLTRTLEMV